MVVGNTEVNRRLVQVISFFFGIVMVVISKRKSKYSQSICKNALFMNFDLHSVFAQCLSPVLCAGSTFDLCRCLPGLFFCAHCSNCFVHCPAVALWLTNARLIVAYWRKPSSYSFVPKMLVTYIVTGTISMNLS